MRVHFFSFLFGGYVFKRLFLLSFTAVLAAWPLWATTTLFHLGPQPWPGCLSVPRGKSTRSLLAPQGSGAGCGFLQALALAPAPWRLLYQEAERCTCGPAPSPGCSIAPLGGWLQHPLCGWRCPFCLVPPHEARVVKHAVLPRGGTSRLLEQTPSRVRACRVILPFLCCASSLVWSSWNTQRAKHVLSINAI